jgi:hypothetical protein
MSEAAGNQIRLPGVKAARDMSAHQYKGVYLSADNTVDVPTGATNKCAGVQQDKPAAAGRHCRVVHIGLTRLYVSGSVAYGNTLSMTTSGWFIKTVSGYHADALCIEDANSGYPAKAFLNPTGLMAVSSAQTAQG